MSFFTGNGARARAVRFIYLALGIFWYGFPRGLRVVDERV